MLERLSGQIQNEIKQKTETDEALRGVGMRYDDLQDTEEEEADLSLVDNSIESDDEYCLSDNQEEEEDALGKEVLSTQTVKVRDPLQKLDGEIDKVANELDIIEYEAERGAQLRKNEEQKETLPEDGRRK